MAIHARFPALQTPWGRLRVQTGDRSLPTTVTGPARLIALYQWRRGKPLPEVWFVDASQGPEHRLLSTIDWSTFPISEARRETMAHEERCARHLPARLRGC